MLQQKNTDEIIKCDFSAQKEKKQYIPILLNRENSAYFSYGLPVWNLVSTYIRVKILDMRQSVYKVVLSLEKYR